jgi:Fe2+ or Zn2+ uptake regulation protein
MPTLKVWKPVPLQVRILEILRENGSCTDDELLKALSKEGETISPETLSRLLLQLEVRGVIHVFNAPRGKKKIEAK